ISIHVLREEDDALLRAPDAAGRHFYPRPPRGGRLTTPPSWLIKAKISIHVLREEDDPVDRLSASPTAHFYPRPPRGGRPPHDRRTAEARRFLSTSSARRTTWNR